MRLADFTPPSTPAAEAARALAEEYHSPALLAHCTRSWLWAEAFAALEGRAGVDRELLYVAALLHDIGIAPEFDNVALSYEEAGGHVAIALTAGAGWLAARRRRVLEVIVRHNWPSVDPAVDVEGYLLETATALDISGARPETCRGTSSTRCSPRTLEVTSRRSSAAASPIRRRGSRRRPRTGWCRTAFSRSCGGIRSSGDGRPISVRIACN